MKKILMVVFCLCMFGVTYAQKVISGKFPSLKTEKKLNIQLDYSKMTIAKMSISDWLEYRQASQPGYDAKVELEEQLKPSLKEHLLSAFNDKMDDEIFFVENGSANYTLKFVVMNVDKKGDNTNECTILDKNGNSLVTFLVKGSGGTFGSMENLWGDGYESTGKKLARILDSKCL